MATSSEPPGGNAVSASERKIDWVSEPTADTMAENTDRTQHISPNPATVAGSAPETSQSAPTAEVPAENTKTVESHRTSSGGSALETNGHTIGKTSPTAATPLAAASNDGSSDFKGEVETNNEIPSIQALRAIENYTVVDRNGKTHPFKSLYSGHNVARRVLIIFIRHFFCGNCQEYLRTLSASVTPEALLGLRVSTFIAVIGCGSHELIDAYVKETQCPFPVYADPTRRLYQELGMVRTLSMGSRPAYLQNKSVAHTVVSGIVQGLKQVKTGLVMKMGDQRQVGGEFLFEPASRTLDTPISSPQHELEKELGFGADTGKVEEKCITWCHRMRTTRDHAEIPELIEVLGLKGDGTPTGDVKKWEKALRSRKGTGVSLASQMSRMSVDATGTAGLAGTGAKV